MSIAKDRRCRRALRNCLVCLLMYRVMVSLGSDLESRRACLCPLACSLPHPVQLAKTLSALHSGGTSCGSSDSVPLTLQLCRPAPVNMLVLEVSGTAPSWGCGLWRVLAPAHVQYLACKLPHIL